MLDGNRKHNIPISTSWLRQPEPSNTQQCQWKHSITSFYLRYIPYSKNPPTPTRRPTIHLPTDARTPNSSISLTVLTKQLSKSKRRLLASLTRVATDETLWSAFRSRQRINIASDCGQSNNADSTFRWVLATDNEILQCSGPVDEP